MVKIRLKRIGRKFHVVYKLVIADSLAPRDGRFIAEVGHYDPHKKVTMLKKDEIMKWLSEGVQPTNTVKRLLKEEKIWSEFKNLAKPAATQK